MGYSYSGRTAAGISASYGIGVVFDSEGNLVAQLNGNIGGGFLGGGSGPTIMFTNAPSYKDLEGWGGIVGGSLSCKFFDFGYDQLFMSGYTGSSLGGNLGIYPFKIHMHGEVGYTVTVGKVNIYQLLESLKFSDVSECS